MSKAFRTALADNKDLKVDNLFGNPRLLIKEFDGIGRGFAFAPSDAPALALAILEAAGVEAKPHEAATVPYGTPAHLGMIASHLNAYAEAKSMNDAEAEAQAELEAEALELCNAAIRQEDGAIYDSFSQVPTPDLWLAVARKAREIGAKK